MPSVSVSDTDGYSFALANETDECVDVSDTLGGDLGTVCAGDPPADFTFEYTYDVGPPSAARPTSPNTASFETNDNARDRLGRLERTHHRRLQPGVHPDAGLLEDPLRVRARARGRDVAPRCPTSTVTASSRAPTRPSSCQARRGTRSSGPSPTATPTTSWPSSTWRRSSTASAGRSTTPAVDTALASAETLFKTYTPAQIASPKGNKQPRPQFISLAGTLGSYNEGKIGPGHCDEDSRSSISSVINRLSDGRQKRPAPRGAGLFDSASQRCGLGSDLERRLGDDAPAAGPCQVAFLGRCNAPRRSTMTAWGRDGTWPGCRR